MKIVIPGGTGQLGRVLTRAFRARGDDVVVLGRGTTAPDGARLVAWDGRVLPEGAPRGGERAAASWAAELDGADVVVNLADRSVNCRYTRANVEAMMSSRVDSTRAVGQAIARAARPPRVWLQMSTATIYAHRFDAANDETTGRLGGDEPDAPSAWKTSIDIARAWEQEQRDAATPATRKVALRTAMVMSPDPGGVLDVLLRLTRLGLGGPIAGGRQFVSWIHERDFARAVEHLIDHDRLTGPVNLASPNPLPQRDFMRGLREACGAPVGLPAAKWMVAAAAVVLRTETELVLKSRRVVPGRLVADGFAFEMPEWGEAARELVRRRRAAR
ncbi:MAG TPA: DUF1731 domain-containing protein [Polyangia bacterium]